MSATPKKEDAVHVPIIYYENWLLKKEGVKNWILYWVVIRDKWLQLFETADDGRKRTQLVKTLELTPRTQCTLVKRRKRRFPFSINNGLGNYYMKCDTELERYHWIFSLLTSALGKPKSVLPTSIPESMLEQEAFKRSPRKENDAQKDKTQAGYHSRRRQKYDERNEKRRQRKEAKRNRKVTEDRGEVTPTPLKRTDELHRSHKIYSGLNALKEVEPNTEHNKTENTKLTKLKQHRNSSSGGTDTKKSNVTAQPKVIKVNVMMHPNDDGTISNVSENYGFEASDNDDDDDDDEDDDEDVNGFSRIEVIPCEEDILPNMVMVQHSDSDTESTEESSIHSQNSLFPNFGSCNDVSAADIFDNELLTPQSRRKGFRSPDHTLAIPADKSAGGTNTKNARTRTLSAGNTKKGPGVVVDRPVSPFRAPPSPRPVSPFHAPVSPRPRSTAENHPRTQFSRFMVSSSVSNG